MIFSPDLAAKIVAGEKTQTRRHRRGETVTGVWVDTPCRYKVGRSYAVQPGRGKKGIARIVVTDVRAEALCDMSDDDVEAEGFRNHAEFEAKWYSLYGKGNWLDPVWAIHFRLEGEGQC